MKLATANHRGMTYSQLETACCQQDVIESPIRTVVTSKLFIYKLH